MNTTQKNKRLSAACLRPIFAAVVISFMACGLSADRPYLCRPYDTSSHAHNLAAQSRFKPILEELGVSFEDFSTIIMAANKLKSSVIDSGKKREGPLAAEIARLNSFITSGRVEIGPRIETAAFKCSGREYRYAAFHLKKPQRTINIIFQEPGSRPTPEELLELNITDVGRHNIDYPGLENTYMLRSDAAQPTPIATALSERSTHPSPDHRLRKEKWGMYDISKDRLKRIVIGNGEFLAYPNLNLSILVTKACNGKCPFCVMGLKYTASKESSQGQPDEKRKAYFENLDMALSQVIPRLDPSVSITGGEPTLDPNLPAILQILKKHGVRKRVITTNGSFLLHKHQGDPKTVMDHLIDYDLEYLNISRAHYDAGRNAELMQLNDPFFSNEDLKRCIDIARTNGIRTRLSVIYNKKGIGSFDDIKKYVEWARSIGIDNVVVRELMAYDKEMVERNYVTDFTDSNFLPVNPLYESMEKDPEFKFVSQVLGYYYYVEVYRYRGVDIVVESADLGQMEAEKRKEHFKTNPKLYELVFHPDGHLGASWRDFKETLLYSSDELEKRMAGKPGYDRFTHAASPEERVTALRLAFDISPEKMSLLLFNDIEKSHLISGWEAGTVPLTPADIVNIAALFSVEPSIILTGKKLGQALAEGRSTGERLRILRTTRGWTEEELADILSAERDKRNEQSVDMDEWVESLGQMWDRVFLNYSLPKTGTVIEIAPGTIPKIGTALRQYGFSGTLYVVEPNKSALEKITKEYEKLLPEAHIIPVQSTLADCLPLLPDQVDGIVANHPLDDMIIGKTMQDEEFQKLFSDPHSGPDSVERLRMAWQRLNENKTRLSQVIQEVDGEWQALFKKTNPAFTAISQYESWGFRTGPLRYSNIHSMAALRQMKRFLGAACRDVQMENALEMSGFDSNRWLTARLRPSRSMAEDLTAAPGALNRVGDDVFLPVQSYKLPDHNTEAIYFNRNLTQAYFGPEETTETVSDKINGSLSVHLAPQDKKYGALDPYLPAYVDYQKDPSGIAMSGNLGSGRAFYLGRRFNIKGAKTPLAKAASDDPIHSDGVLDMETAVWETMVSNALNQDLRTGTSPVLAMIDTKRPLENPSPKVPLASETLLVRIDDGQLDRPTHLFKRGEPVSGEQLMRMADLFGKEEAEKFIERILHGCWSAGNISIEGHMLDYDTVRSVHSRAPQTLGTIYFPTNLFGLEQNGQFMILKNFVESPLNRDNVSLQQVRAGLEKSYRDRITSRLPDLMGFDIILKDRVMRLFEKELYELSDEFQHLSRMMYDRYDAVDIYSPKNDELAIFDFSRFFRLYPVLKRSGQWNIRNAMALLLNPDGKLGDGDKEGFPASLKNYIRDNNFTVSTEKELAACLDRAVRFITAYDRTFGRLNRSIFTRKDMSAEMKAYVVNEDRRYMDGPLGRSFKSDVINAYKTGEFGRERFNTIIEKMIQANRRIPSAAKEDRYVSDVEIFKDGHSGRYLSRRGTCLFFLSIFKDEWQNKKTAGQYRMTVQGRSYPCFLEDEGAEIRLVSPEFDNSILLARDLDVCFYSGDDKIDMSPFKTASPPKRETADNDRMTYKASSMLKSAEDAAHPVGEWEKGDRQIPQDDAAMLAGMFNTSTGFTRPEAPDGPGTERLEAEAETMHINNLKYQPAIPRRTIFCQIVDVSILPEGQRNMLNRLEKAMRDESYSEKMVALSCPDPDRYVSEVGRIMQTQKDANPDCSVIFEVACPDTKHVSKLLASGLELKALAFEPRKEGDVDIVQVEGIMLALRALYTGNLQSLKRAFSLLSGKELPGDLAAITNIEEFAAKALFSLPAAKTFDHNQRRRLNEIIVKYILASA